MTKPSDFFAYPAWQPLAAVGSHGPRGELDLQICISIMGASIVPEKPRLLVVLWKQNYTHGLVAASASLCVSLLTADQLDTFADGKLTPFASGLSIQPVQPLCAHLRASRR